jgi:hypothetical protein
MKTHSCLVVAQSESTRSFLAAALKSIGMIALPLASLGELRKTLEEVSACGILVEMMSAVMASPQEKKDAKDLLELYPSAKFRISEERVLIVGETLEEFVSRCLAFNPRLTRKSVREQSYLAIHLSADAGFTDAERAVTLNVSESGYFVVTMGEWKIGDRVWLRFPDAGTTVGGTIRSYRPWGNNKTLPGIGIQIDAGSHLQ